MDKKKKNNLTRPGKYVFPAVIGLAVLVGVISITAAKANVPFWDKVAEYTGIRLAEKIDVPPEEDVQLGAFPGPDIYEQIRFHAGLQGEAAIDIPINMTAGTTTPGGTVVVLGSYCHSGNTMLVTNWDWGIYTANSVWGVPDFAIGTTTKTGHESFTATTTGTLVASSQIATSSVGMFARDGYGAWQFDGDVDAGATTVTTTIGSFYTDRGIDNLEQFATSTPFVLNSEDCVVASLASEGGATSSDSFTSGGGELFVAALHLEAIFR